MPNSNTKQCLEGFYEAASNFSSTMPQKTNLSQIFEKFKENARDMNVNKVRESRKKLD